MPKLNTGKIKASSRLLTIKDKRFENVARWVWNLGFKDSLYWVAIAVSVISIFIFGRHIYQGNHQAVSIYFIIFSLTFMLEMGRAKSRMNKKSGWLAIVKGWLFTKIINKFRTIPCGTCDDCRNNTKCKLPKFNKEVSDILYTYSIFKYQRSGLLLALSFLSLLCGFFWTLFVGIDLNESFRESVLNCLSIWQGTVLTIVLLIFGEIHLDLSFDDVAAELIVKEGTLEGSVNAGGYNLEGRTSDKESVINTYSQGNDRIQFILLKEVFKVARKSATNDSVTSDTP